MALVKAWHLWTQTLLSFAGPGWAGCETKNPTATQANTRKQRTRSEKNFFFLHGASAIIFFTFRSNQHILAELESPRCAYVPC